MPELSATSLTASPEAWLVPLSGHPFDLEDLRIYLDQNVAQVVKRSGEYFLLLPASVAGSNYQKVNEYSRIYIAQINGAMRVLIASYRPVELARSAYLCLNQSGEIIRQILPYGVAEERNKSFQLTALVGDAPAEGLRKGLATRLLAKAANRPVALDALTIIGRSQPTWAELYIVYELVESSSKGQMFVAGWISKAEGTLFTRTANSYDILGTTGRHGKQTNTAPKTPMSYPDALQLIRTLVGRWFDSLQTTEVGESTYES
jgi:hypothetical protein